MVAGPSSVSGGIAGIGGRNSIVDYDSFYGSGRRIPSHELGHDLLLTHANLISCNWVDITKIVDTCKIIEYGDNSDFMGGGSGINSNTNMYNRVLMGFYSESLFINASTTVSGSYTLKDTHQVSGAFVTDSLALTFYFPEIYLGATSGGTYGGIASTNRYIIELWSGSGSCNVYVRIIFSKAASWFNKQAYRVGMLTIGQSFKDAINNVEFTFVEKDDLCLTAKILVKP